MNLEERLIVEAAAVRATDIHIDPDQNQYVVRFRVDGRLYNHQVLDYNTGVSLVNQVKASVGIEPGMAFIPRGERLKTSIGGHNLDLRVTLVPCLSGPKLAIRVLDTTNVVRDIPCLGLQADDRSKLEQWSRTLNGMILVTGPTSSGKTTTLYSLLHEISEESRHVVTIEDPVEYEIDGINQIQVDLRHHLSFAEGVKTALRLDPDCLMVGEIRSGAAANEAINAAVQGHVVMATMHSRDAVSAVTRLRNFDIENHQIATSLGVVVNQRLIRTLCNFCKEEVEITEEIHKFFERSCVTPPAKVFRAVGCKSCLNTGYIGRTGIFEIWNLNQADYTMILNDTDEETIREHRRLEDHQFILHDAATKLYQGITTYEEILYLGLDLPWNNR